MKLLVTGANGLVGSHFVENFKALHQGILLTPDQEEMDITNQGSIKAFFSLHQPDAIIHFAAFTNVSQAEEQRHNQKASCWIVNVEGTANLIQALNPKSYFIHISTDMVFPGNKDYPGPYQESDSLEENPNLLSWYGWTKKEAENIVKNNGKNAGILRISNPVRAKYATKLDYVRKILALYDKGKLYPLFDDQYLTLTYINEVTKTLQILLEKRLNGIFHTSSSNVFTPYNLANLLIEKARGRKDVVKPVSIKSFLKDNPFRYPQYGGLDTKETQHRLGLKFMSWEEIIEDLAKQL